MLIIFEMANNHMGDVEHGVKIINEFARVKNEFPKFDYAFKFQYRDLPTFIHPSADPEDKYVKRFRDTNLSREDRKLLKDIASLRGFWTACTPFDEESVDHVIEDGYDILKVGSPSFTDWLLWNKIIMSWNGPVIASCGGATEEDIDRIACMYKDGGLTLMHCVSEYPTLLENLQLNQIDLLKNRYPDIPIGYSTHESHISEGTVLAVAKGISALERHVCLYEHVLEPKPNEYSMSVQEMEDELLNLSEIQKMLGGGGRVPGPKPTQFMRRMIDGRMWWKP